MNSWEKFGKILRIIIIIIIITIIISFMQTNLSKDTMKFYKY